MSDETPNKPIADDIPATVAWKAGRRIYVRCGYNSTLNGALREIGAKWDKDARALWVGSGKLEQALPLVRAHVARIEQVTEAKASNRWVVIPIDAVDIRTQAKALGAIWDADRRMWALPTDEALSTVTGLVETWKTARDAEQAAQRAADDAARHAAQLAEAAGAADAAKGREATVIARSGRVTLAKRGTASGRLYGRMRRDRAEQAKPQPGEVRQLDNGSRVLVLSCKVEFWSQDAIDDGFTPDLSDEPGWFYQYSYVVVEPTADEVDYDRREAAEQADLNEIDAVMRAAHTGLTAVDAWRHLVGPSITADAPGGLTSDARITITDEGVWYQHPGYYDDYRRTEREITDPAMVERIRAIVAAGPRRRGQYAVKVPE